MANPFQNIIDQRAAIQGQQIEEKLKIDRLEQQKLQALSTAEEYYGPIIMQILEQLALAAYPASYCVKKSGSFPASWQIGCIQWLVDDEGTQYSSWEAVAGVFLEYNEQKQSVCFDCWRKGKDTVVSNLTEAELIAALQLLYSQ